jgi:hypothetical protein
MTAACLSKAYAPNKTMAIFEKSGLSCAKFAQCVKLEGFEAVLSFEVSAPRLRSLRLGGECLQRHFHRRGAEIAETTQRKTEPGPTGSGATYRLLKLD